MNSSSEAIQYLQDFFAQYAQTTLDDASFVEQRNDLKEDLLARLQGVLNETGEQEVDETVAGLLERYFACTEEEIDVLCKAVLGDVEYATQLKARTEDVIIQSVDREQTLPNLLG